MYSPRTSEVWLELQQLAAQHANDQIIDYFTQNPQRFEQMNIKAAGLLLDYSKNKINSPIFDALIRLLKECSIQDAVTQMYEGERINCTEKRSVLHTALRKRNNKAVYVNSSDVMPDVNRALEHMKNFVEQVHSHKWLGYTGKPIRNIVNIGIGGSDLGPHMVCEALQANQIDGVASYFVSNVDSAHLFGVLDSLVHDETLFIVSSKSFTTQETMLNSHSAKQWFLSQAGNYDQSITQHFVAVSTNLEAVTKFGIAKENMFEFWDWVGGRYSLWSSIGLPIALSIGFSGFEELLEGAHAMDEHFKEAPIHQNLPMLMAMIGVWNVNFLGADNQAVIPYDQELHLFPAFLQQLDMESNGKTIDKQGMPVDYATGPIVWGQTGTNGQHAFFQLLHQGANCIPVDFIASLEQNKNTPEHNMVLLTNMLAQAEALMIGNKTPKNSYSYCEGNKPSNVLLLDDLSPKRIGALVAAYEHKVFVQGVIWNINSFDQWGVQLGKTLAANMNDGKQREHDSSTTALLKIVQQSCEA
jgi:glucose-6-phosphate isomerase